MEDFDEVGSRGRPRRGAVAHEAEAAAAVVRRDALVVHLGVGAGLAGFRDRLADHRLGLEHVVAILLDEPAILVQTAIVLAARDLKDSTAAQSSARLL